MKTRKIQKKSLFVNLKGQWVPAVAYGLLIVVMFLLQMTPRVLPEVWGARPWLMVPLTVFIAMFEGPLTGGVCGAVAGFLWDMFSQRLPGFSALFLLVIGVACGLLVQVLLRNNVLSAMMLSSSVTVGYGLYQWFFCTVIWGKEDAWFVLWRLTLPDIVYTICISIILYYVLYFIAKHLKQTE